MFNNFIKIIIIVFCLIAAGCASSEKNLTDKIEINGFFLNVEIAETENQRMKGLMERRILDQDHGMLFVFESDRKLSFWMKNTYIPLSIAFINSEGIIREIRDMTPESLDPVNSRNNVRYALEVNRNYFASRGIKPGDKVILPEKYRR